MENEIKSIEISYDNFKSDVIASNLMKDINRVILSLVRLALKKNYFIKENIDRLEYINEHCIGFEAINNDFICIDNWVDDEIYNMKLCLSKDGEILSFYYADNLLVGEKELIEFKCEIIENKINPIYIENTDNLLVNSILEIKNYNKHLDRIIKYILILKDKEKI